MCVCWGGGGYIYLTLHRHQNEFCMKMGSDASHFSISRSVNEASKYNGSHRCPSSCNAT